MMLVLTLRWPRSLSCILVAVGLVTVFAPAGHATAAVGQISRMAPGQREVALTFNGDAWPGRINTNLQTLRDHHTRLTFFLTVDYLINFPAQARAIFAAGQEIASHGYEQHDYRDLSNPQIMQRLDLWQDAFARLTGVRGPTFWEAPYGASDSRVRQAARDRGYTTIYWTLDSLDAVGAPKSRAFSRNRVLNTSWVTLDGAIVLLHVNGDGTVAGLHEILDTLEKRGLRVVTISELVKR